LMLRRSNTHTATHLHPPLLTSSNVQFLLLDTRLPAQDQVANETGRAGNQSKDAPTNKWPDSVVLKNLDAFRNDAPARLLERIELALEQAELRPDIQPMIDRELGELEVLRLLRTTKTASKN
ncbi:MAG: hypothetical protein ACREFN_13375, partial [Acetobacteraceae bacterium]